MEKSILKDPFILDKSIDRILENMIVKVLVQRKKLKQALDSSMFLEEDIQRIKKSLKGTEMKT